MNVLYSTKLYWGWLKNENALVTSFSILVRGPNTERISKRNSTGNASWGVGPNAGISKRNSTGNASWGGTTK